MSPLGQLAESATGLFGLRIPGVARSMVPGMSPGGTRRAEPEPFVEPEPAPVPPAPAVEHPTPPKRTTPPRQTQATAAKGGGEAQAAGEDGGGEAQAPVQPPLTARRVTQFAQSVLGVENRA